MKMASSQDVAFSEGAIEEGRKLAQQALERVARLILQTPEGVEPEERPTAIEERWILARLSQTQRANRAATSPSSTSRTSSTSSTT